MTRSDCALTPKRIKKESKHNYGDDEFEEEKNFLAQMILAMKKWLRCLVN